MRHRVAGRKLGRTSAHRLALLRNLSTALFDKERITTTLVKAKELRPFAEKLVTLAKRETLHSRRRVLRHIHDRQVVAKLFDTLSARYAQRPGGYTRIIKLGPRRGDHAEMALIELVDAEIAGKPAEAEAEEAPKRKKAAGKPAEAEAEEAPKRKKAAGKKQAAKSKSEGKSEASAKEKTAKKKTTKKKTSARRKKGAGAGEK